MPSSPEPSAPKDQPGAPENLSDQSIHDLLTPMAIIKGQTQMLRRWVKRSGPADGDAMLARLAVIDEMISQVVRALDSRRPNDRSPSTGDDAEPRSGAS